MELDARTAGWLELVVFAAALVVFIAGAGGGPGWDLASGHAVLGAQLVRTAAAPLYGLLADLAAQLPVGEPGFRLAVLGAILGAATVGGVVAAGRAVLPKDPFAGAIGAVLLALSPPFRDATAAASPSILAACGVVWAFAGAAAHARASSPRLLAVALVGVAAVLGSAPWLGLVIAVAMVGWLARGGARRDHLAIGVGAIGLALVAWWLGAVGSLPGLQSSLSAMVGESGRGAAAVVVGTGLLGAAFGAMTGLVPARWLALVIAAAAIHAILVDPAPAPLLAAFAVGCAIVPSAVARIVPGERRAWVVAAAGIPLIGAALITGATLRFDDAGAAPARLATDVVGDLPSGPGMIVATRGTVWSAINYAQIVAGTRPDLSLAAPLAPEAADIVVADALRAKQLAVSDVPAFGRLDPALSLARGRGFELRADHVDPTGPVPVPARYASAIGERQGVALAISRARHEAGNGRLDAAARAAGLTSRFGAAELAMLATTSPSRDRPALFGFLPRLDDPSAGTWRLDLLGDDLAWVAGVEQPLVSAPPSRKLHGLWRELLMGKRTPGDPDIASLGPAAVEATRELLNAVRP